MPTDAGSVPVRRQRPPTLADVARVAGVATITASRALGNPGLVAPGTIDRVRAAADALGYVPNLLAGGLKSSRSRLVAVLVPAIAMPQLLPALQALTDTLDTAGYQLIVGQAGFDHGRESTLLDALLSRRPDGIVLVGLVEDPRVRARLLTSGVPVVETWDLTDAPVDMLVGFSHRDVGRAVAGFFLRKGYVDVGAVTADDRRSRARLEAFADALGTRPPVVTVPAPSTMGSGRAGLAQLLARCPALRAVYCSSDQLAQGVIAEAHARRIEIPRELAVFGYGDADFAAFTEPPLSTVHVDGTAIGRMAGQFIIDRCRSVPVPQPVIDVGFRIVERASA